MEVSGAAAAVATGSAALLGNYRPVFMRFQRGGKMVATGGGVLFGLAPKAAAIGAGIWLLVALITRYSSLASLTVGRPDARGRGADRIPWEVIAFTVVLAVAIFVLHRANIRRLLNGTEHAAVVPSGAPKFSSGAIVRPRRLSPLQ